MHHFSRSTRSFGGWLKSLVPFTKQFTLRREISRGLNDSILYCNSLKIYYSMAINAKHQRERARELQQKKAKSASTPRKKPEAKPTDSGHSLLTWFQERDNPTSSVSSGLADYSRGGISQ